MVYPLNPLMTLPASYARCHDAACPQRTSCLRWLERDTGGERTSHVATLRFLAGICHGYISTATPPPEAP